MSKTTTTFETEDEFLESDLSDTQVLRDADGNVWLAWPGEDDWYALRPRSEDEPKGPDGDEPRPIGPEPLDSVPFPVIALDVHVALVEGGA